MLSDSYDNYPNYNPDFTTAYDKYKKFHTDIDIPLVFLKVPEIGEWTVEEGA